MKDKQDFVLNDLDLKIIKLNEIYNDYIKLTFNNDLNSFAQYEHQEKNITTIDSNKKEILNSYLNTKKEVIASLSLIARQCLISENYIDEIVNFFKILEKTYHPNSGYYDVYSHAYLESILPSLKLIVEHNFVNILDLYLTTRNEQLESVIIANLQLKHALPLSIAFNSFILSDDFDESYIKSFQDLMGNKDVEKLILSSVKTAYNIHKINTYNFTVKHFFLKDMLLDKIIFNQTNYKDIIVDLFSYKELGLFYDFNMIKGLNKCYNHILTKPLENKELFKNDIFWKISFLKSKEFFNILKDSHDNRFKQIALFVKTITANNKMDESDEIFKKKKVVIKDFGSEKNIQNTVSLISNVSIDKKINVLSYDEKDVCVIDKIKNMKRNSVDIIDKHSGLNEVYDGLVSQYKQLNSLMFNQNNKKEVIENINISLENMTITSEKSDFITDIKNSVLENYDFDEDKTEIENLLLGMVDSDI